MDVFNYTVKINPVAGGGYWAEVPALPGCFTQGETLEEVMAMAHEAIECHLAALLRRSEPFPVDQRVERAFSFPITVRAPKPA